jgi:endonuclease/exonuclease/phosphatase family metal-dependent hydrolase
MADRTDSRPRPRLLAARPYTRAPRVALLALLVASGCAGNATLVRRPAGASDTVWYGPSRQSDVAALSSWAAAVGPAVVIRRPEADVRSVASMVVVSWNIAVGGGDVAALVRDIRARHPGAAVTLLVQEAFRKGPEVPRQTPSPSRFAGRLGTSPAGHEIEEVAHAAGLNLYYVPSMRNGAPSATDEDRGNAILSTLPLEQLTAFELPYERQRRVAVAASLAGLTPAGAPFQLRVVSAHLDNNVGPQRLWFLGGMFARHRQMQAIVRHVEGEAAAIVGGDFNTWFGFAEPAFASAYDAFPDTDIDDRRPTFRNLLRLDHVFFRLPDGWSADVERGPGRYGSDHWPLIATIRIG